MVARGTGHAVAALSPWLSPARKAEKGEGRHGVKVGDDPLLVPIRHGPGSREIRPSWARPAAGRRKEGGKALCHLKKQPAKEKKRQRRKGEITYSTIYFVSLTLD